MRIFGTDGIRGQANTDVTPELALRLGRALVTVLGEEGVARPDIVVGRDPRISGHMLQAALSAGITSAGGNAVNLGVVPTPAVAHAAVRTAAAGVMISASHNPVQDNGLKVFGGDGFKLTDAEEGRLEELLQHPDGPRPSGAGIGSIWHDRASVDAYADAVVASAGGVDLGGMRVVVDSANGSASGIAADIYGRLGADVVSLHGEPDGLNINAGCGSTHPEVIRDAVLAHGADVGIAHDGDADRLICADAAGNEVDGDVVLAGLASDMFTRGVLAGDAVVTTVMTNLGFHRAMADAGIEVVTTDVGDRYVLDAMRARELSLGGEQSGHLICLDHATTGDGILSAVMVLASLRRRGLSMQEFASVMQRLPQVLVNVPEVERAHLSDATRVWDAVREVQDRLGAEGRVLVRPSGTEPLVRVMVEAMRADDAEQAAQQIALVVSDELALS